MSEIDAPGIDALDEPSIVGGAVAPAHPSGSEPGSGPDKGFDLADPSLYLNRELSWLEFNRRVLTHATDTGVPLLERLRFIAIFASNLDEFFQVRVAGLRRQVAAGVTSRSPDGRTPGQQLQAIAERLGPMVAAAADCLHDQLVPLLAKEGLAILDMSEVDTDERAELDRFFAEEVFPVLTPLAVDPSHPFPYISNLSLSLAVGLRDPETREIHFARVKVPGVLPRFFVLPRGGGFVPLEDLITVNLDQLFPGMEVVEAYPFRVTRNTDIEIEEDEAEDLLLAIEKELRRRRFGAVVRLEVDERMPEHMRAVLQDELDVGDSETYRIRGLLGLDALEELADIERPTLRYPPWHPLTHARFRASDGRTPDVFAEIRRGDILVQHPYESFAESVERFVAVASEDPRVLAIKQTLYRTSGDSPIVRSLIRAAERGKQVVALVELKARFDEEANILWARALEKAGVHVVYGLVGLKTHAKTTLIVRREPEGIRRYAHFGTGNYNPWTARLYTDLGLFTCDPELGADLTDLFNYLTGFAPDVDFRRLLMAPMSLRDHIRALIDRQVDRQRSTGDGLIRAKLNSLVDQPLIKDLYRASQAGVRIDLVIRGICGLRPGIPGLSDRIRVISVVGRLLEHERVLQFGDDDFWIGSPDWMPRNLDRRVETMVPVDAGQLREQLRTLLDTSLGDTVNAWTLQADGTWVRRHPLDGEEPVDSQSQFVQLAHQRNR